MDLLTVAIEKPEPLNFILGQSHFIKTVEDVHEYLVGSVPGIAFGLAFCEASGPCLVRQSGTDPQLTALAARNAQRIGAGHSFILFLGKAFPKKRMKQIPEICRIFCATANPTEVIVAQSDQGRGILGVIDGFSPAGIETDEDVVARKAFLRKIGYKFS